MKEPEEFCLSSEEGLHHAKAASETNKQKSSQCHCKERSRATERALKKSSLEWVENITSSRAPKKHVHSNIADEGKTLAKDGERRVPGPRAGLAGRTANKLASGAKPAR